ncbi:MAG: Omp28-related outer membrane protein [Saprospiraceae bacterium]|nr:Omp28-related outer membrane protein [Saprospiraceae bacterium]MCB9324888.1 Omp28-related outer membrane protein [Lewinellaceae bacterium]
MQKIKIFLLAIPFICFSCHETIVPITIIQPEGDRVVLMEEFSGGSCVPCANAHAEIQNLLAVYPDNLIVITMHTFVGGQGNPVPGSTYDFRNQEAHDILENLGYPEGIPSGIINRKLFDTEPDLQLGLPSWPGYIASEVEIQPKLSVYVENEYDQNTRNLVIRVNLLPLEDLQGDLRLTVVITESGIINKQQTPDGVVDDYVHNHIFRDAISSTEGDVLGTLKSQEEKLVTYSYTLPEADGSGPWIPENCEIIAFVSYAGQGGGIKDVLQAGHAKVIE